MFVFADKTRNLYETSLETYNNLLHHNITKTYKRRSENNISEIDSEINHIADDLSIGKQIECMKKKKLLFLFKTLKEIFKTIQNADFSIQQKAT